MIKRISALLVALVLAITVTGCGNENTNTNTDAGQMEKITFVLDWTPNTNHTGLYAAIENGYFAEEGLDVEIVQPPEDGADSLVASGKAQFGVSFQDTLASALSADSPLPISAVCSIVQHNTSGIISRAGEGADRPKGLENKNYATWNGPIELAIVEQAMKSDGGDFEKLKLIPSTVTDEVSALKTKSADAIWIYYGWAGIKTEMENLKTDYFAFKDINPVLDYYTPIVIGNNKFLKENPETSEKFIRALSKGYNYAIENPEEAADILCKAAPELDPALAKESQKYMSKEYKSDAPYWGYIDETRWNNFFTWLNDNGLTKNTLSKNAGLDTSIIHSLEK